MSYASKEQLATLLQRVEDKFGKKADLVDGKVPLSQLPDIGSLPEIVKANQVLMTTGTAGNFTSEWKDIPIATDSNTGVVLSSQADDGVSVELNGTMVLNNLNVNKLKQSEGDELLLDCGNAGVTVI